MGRENIIAVRIVFHQKGYNYSASQNGLSLKSHTTLNYLDLPVLVKIKFGKFYAVVGPSISLGIGGNYKFIQSVSGATSTNTGKVKFGKEPDNSVDSDESYYDNRLDVGVQTGIGMQVSFGMHMAYLIFSISQTVIPVATIV
ncbi:MAG: outer membrane beta-barrel protein [Chryseolinea sp.]